MKKKISIWEVGFFTLISLFSLFFILTKTDPYNDGLFVILLFYLSFFVAVSGIIIIWKYFSKRKLLLKNGIIWGGVLTALILLYRIWT